MTAAEVLAYEKHFDVDNDGGSVASRSGRFRDRQIVMVSEEMLDNLELVTEFQLATAVPSIARHYLEDRAIAHPSSADWQTRLLEAARRWDADGRPTE